MSGHAVAAIWRTLVPDWQPRLAACIQDAATARTATTRIFFRADDVGVPGKRYREMVRVFARLDVPLNLAVVPTWLTAERWRALARIGREAAHLWCWHQHGWRHQNHEPRGKKQEFGPARDFGALRDDLDRGRHRLEDLLGPQFFPVFTPPWNRCSAEVLAHLHRTGYAAVSRSRGSRPACPRGFSDMAVDIDLHTRKDADPRGGWPTFLDELTHRLTNPTCGFMLHHQRMNPNAMAGLEYLITQLKQSQRFAFEDFRSLCHP
jgi:hypothetical protein